MAQVCEVVLGATEPIGGEYRDATGALVTGSSTVVLSIRRASDGHRLDFSDSTFKSTPTTATLALTETPASSGFYLYSLDTSVLAAGQNYLVSVVDTSISTVLSGLGGELRVRGINALSSAVAALPSASSITTAVWAAGARTLTTLGTGTITSTTIADDAITAAKIAANAITAAKIATDAIGADQLAAGAVTEIQSGLATATALATAKTAIDAIPTTAAPSAATVSAQVASDLATAHGAGSWATATGFAEPGDAMTLASGAVSAAALATDAVAEIVAATWGEGLPGTYASGEAGYVLANAGGGGADPAVIAAAVADQALSGHTTAGTVGAALSRVDVATSTLATASALTTAQGDLTAIKGAGFTTGDDLHSAKAAIAAIPTTAAPSASTVSAQVASDLATAHGVGAWTTATGFAVAGDAMTLQDNAITAAKIATDAIGASQVAAGAVAEIQSGLATATNVTNAVTAINAHTDTAAGTLATDLATAHGVGSWATATGFAVAGDAMSLTSSERTSVGTAVWATATRTITGSVSIANGAITAATFGSSAITGTALAASAVTAIQSGIATAAALATAQSAIEALPGSRDISAEVVADLASAHGSGAWTTANVSALATTSQLGTAQTAIIAAMPAAAPSASTIAASVVAQAIAGASAGSVGAALATASGYTVPTASQNAAAVWATDISDYGTYAQIALAGGALYGLKIGAFNKMTEAAGNPGTLTIYRDNGSTTYVTYALRDSAGSATTATSGAPAQRAAAV